MTGIFDAMHEYKILDNAMFLNAFIQLLSLVIQHVTCLHVKMFKHRDVAVQRNCAGTIKRKTQTLTIKFLAVNVYSCRNAHHHRSSRTNLNSWSNDLKLKSS